MISVILPVYNVEKYLRECLDCILRQTYQDFEVLLIDDGSADSSGQICDEYAAKDKRFVVIHRKNAGVSSARNLGMQKAKGEYIAFIDSDDMISDDYLEKLHQGILEGNADVCLCKFSRMRDSEIVVEEEKYLKAYINDKGMDAFFESFLSHYITVLCENSSSYLMGTVWRMLFRKSSFPYFLPEDISISEDLIFVMRNFPVVNRINIVDEALYFYRDNNTSAMSNYRKNFLSNQHAYLREFETILRGLDLSNKKQVEETITAQKALSTAFLFGNEIRFRKWVEDFKGNIERLKADKLFAYLTLKNAFKIKHKGMKIKYLGIWFLIKVKVYKVL